MRRVPFVAYNLGPIGERVDNERARVELDAAVNNQPRVVWRRRPKAVALMECVGRDLPDLRHYHPPIHDRSRKSRANLALYVLDRLDLGRREWVDHQVPWPRVLHAGLHEPRSTLIQEVEDWTFVVSHAPQSPRNVFREPLRDALNDAREEWVDIIADIARSTSGPLLIFTDPNGLGGELRRRVPSLVLGGTATEAVHGRRVVLVDARKVSSVNGVRFLSDHRGALVGKARRRN